MSLPYKVTHHFVLCFLFFIMAIATFSSSAIRSISDVNESNEVSIVYNSSDKVYVYKVADREAWENDLNDVISEGESVGRFVGRAVKTKVLEIV